MKHILLIAILIIPITLFGQINATTSTGQEVLLNEDGTWEYIEAQQNPSPSSPLSSSCTDLIRIKEDKVTGNKHATTTEILSVTKDDKKGLLFNILKTKTSLILSISAVGAGNCIDDDDNVNILFRDGSKLEIGNDADFNCDNNFTLYFGGVFGKKKQLESLISKEIETMRVWTSDGYVQEDFDSEQSQLFMASLKCLSEIEID